MKAAESADEWDLIKAAKWGDVQRLTTLLQKGVRADVEVCDFKGEISWEIEQTFQDRVSFTLFAGPRVKAGAFVWESLSEEQEEEWWDLSFMLKFSSEQSTLLSMEIFLL